MTTITIDLKGVEPLLKKLDPQRYERVMHVSMYAALDLPRADMEHYPEKSEANRERSWSPGGDNRWYERGFGPKWVRKDGTVKGYQLSQVLGKSWVPPRVFKEVRRKTMGLVGTVGTNVSYAPFVQDAGQQAVFHKARGWKTVQDALKSNVQNIRRIFEQGIRRAIR